MACVAGFEGFQLAIGKREIFVGKTHVIRRSTVVLDIDGELDGRWRRSRERGDSEGCKNSRENGLILHVGRVDSLGNIVSEMWTRFGLKFETYEENWFGLTWMRW